jgi:transketolase N-terminal domain/subunit
MYASAKKWINCNYRFNGKQIDGTTDEVLGMYPCKFEAFDWDVIDIY